MLVHKWGLVNAYTPCTVESVNVNQFANKDRFGICTGVFKYLIKGEDNGV